MASSIPIKKKSFLNRSTPPDQSGPRSNDNERVLNILQLSRTGASLSNAEHPFCRETYQLYRGY